MTEETHNKVLSIVANIVNNQEQTSDNNSKDEDEEVETWTSIKKEQIRGIPKSGRFWKSKKERLAYKLVQFFT